MHYYLTGWKGSGQPEDAFTPDIGDAPVWEALDLRTDPTRRHGFCLVACMPQPTVTPPGATYLGRDGALDLSPTLRTTLGTALGVQLSATTLLEAIHELLTVHARDDGTRWQPLKPTRTAGQYVWEIKLGSLRWARSTPTATPP